MILQEKVTMATSVSYRVLLVAFLVSICTLPVTARSKYDLFTDITMNYDSRLRPNLGEDKPMVVNISFHVVMLRSFDDVKGELSILASFQFTWLEDRLKWDPSMYKNVTELVIPRETVWIPNVMIPNLIHTDNQPGRSASQVRIHSDGQCSMHSIDLLNIYCPADVHDYPYDTQQCQLLILPVEYKHNEMNFGLPNNERSTSQDSTEWKILEISTNVVKHKDTFRIDIQLQRLSTYALLTMTIPTLLLGCINPLVFILPPDSGERVTFSITTFLSFTVSMSILTDNIPRGSTPMASLMCFVFIMLVYSMVILICTIVSLRIHTNHGKKQVPKTIGKLAKCLKLSNCKWRNSTVSNLSDTQSSVPQIQNKQHGVKDVHANAEKPPSGKMGLRQHVLEFMTIRRSTTLERENFKISRKDGNTSETIVDDTEITWTDVGNVFDICMLICFGICLFVLFIIFYITRLVI